MAEPIICDRCGEEIKDAFRGLHATAGFYDVTGDSWWSRYSRPGERNVCDICMWKDEGYRRDYGIHAAGPTAVTIASVERAKRKLREAQEVSDIAQEFYGDIKTL